MASLPVKPTRMELSNLKKRLKVAIRGHKLMKDKHDELVRRFIGYARRNRDLRMEVEGMLQTAMRAFVLARAVMSEAEIEEALLAPARAAAVNAGIQSILSIHVPALSIEAAEKYAYPYGFMTTSADLDDAVQQLAEVLPRLLELAEVEKTCSRLAEEIEKTRRRVNALEYVMIPQFTETIRQIQMKLDENERSNTTRLMKTKEMIQKQRA